MEQLFVQAQVEHAAVKQNWQIVTKPGACEIEQYRVMTGFAQEEHYLSTQATYTQDKNRKHAV